MATAGPSPVSTARAVVSLGTSNARPIEATSAGPPKRKVSTAEPLVVGPLEPSLTRLGLTRPTSRLTPYGDGPCASPAVPCPSIKEPPASRAPRPSMAPFVIPMPTRAWTVTSATLSASALSVFPRLHWERPFLLFYWW